MLLFYSLEGLKGSPKWEIFENSKLPKIETFQNRNFLKMKTFHKQKLAKNANFLKFFAKNSSISDFDKLKNEFRVLKPLEHDGDLYFALKCLDFSVTPKFCLDFYALNQYNPIY